jgi:hypothetical protein
MKHAVRVALAKPRCRVALVERDGTIRVARNYDQGADSHHVEV